MILDYNSNGLPSQDELESNYLDDLLANQVTQMGPLPIYAQRDAALADTPYLPLQPTGSIAGFGLTQTGAEPGLLEVLMRERGQPGSAAAAARALPPPANLPSSSAASPGDRGGPNWMAIAAALEGFGAGMRGQPSAMERMTQFNARQALAKQQLESLQQNRDLMRQAQGQQVKLAEQKARREEQKQAWDMMQGLDKLLIDIAGKPPEQQAQIYDMASPTVRAMLSKADATALSDPLIGRLVMGRIKEDPTDFQAYLKEGATGTLSPERQALAHHYIVDAQDMAKRLRATELDARSLTHYQRVAQDPQVPETERRIANQRVVELQGKQEKAQLEVEKLQGEAAQAREKGAPGVLETERQAKLAELREKEFKGGPAYQGAMLESMGAASTRDLSAAERNREEALTARGLRPGQVKEQVAKGALADLRVKVISGKPLTPAEQYAFNSMVSPEEIRQAQLALAQQGHELKAEHQAATNAFKLMVATAKFEGDPDKWRELGVKYGLFKEADAPTVLNAIRKALGLPLSKSISEITPPGAAPRPSAQEMPDVSPVGVPPQARARTQDGSIWRSDGTKWIKVQ